MRSILFALAIVFSLISNNCIAGEVKAPQFVDGAITISADELLNLMETEVDLKVFDTRPLRSYNISHLPGAEHFLATEVNAERLDQLVSGKGSPIVFYCQGVSCPRAAVASSVAVAEGYKKVFYYYGGLEDWFARNLPIDN